MRLVPLILSFLLCFTLVIGTAVIVSRYPKSWISRSVRSGFGLFNKKIINKPSVHNDEETATVPEPVAMPVPEEPPVEQKDTGTISDQVTENPLNTISEVHNTEVQEPEEQPATEQEVDISDQKLNAPAAVTEIPTAPVEQQGEPSPTEPIEEVPAEITGIDTVGLEEPRGNWLFKRIWWERSEQQYSKIRGIVEKIDEMRMQFFARRTELDKVVFDPFFIDIGFSQGELLGSLTRLLENIEQHRKKDAVLTDQEREILERVHQDRELLQQLHRDVQSIALLENASDELIERVMEQRARVARYEREAWDNMREIARILSDTQARELYYKVDAAWRNVKAIHAYLDQDLKRYFDQLVTNAKEQVDRIKIAMQTLKEKGIDVKHSFEQIEEQQPIESEAERVEREEKERVVAMTKKPKSLMAKGFAAVSSIIKGFSNLVLWLPRKVMGLFFR
jgi:hypothetical protein